MTMRVMIAALAAFTILFATAPVATLTGSGISERIQESASAQSEPERVYFPETGQYLGGELLDFWWEYGGVPVFGFPVTGEIEQNGMTVQYFERAVLEKHPDNPPEWQILLRRLGAHKADEGRRDHPAFSPSHPASTGKFFPETEKNLQHGFLDHWEANGAVRIFGYPISSEFEEDGHTVQYFERAIFEYHPDHSPEWRILQPLIGNQAARRDGVDRSAKPHDESVPVYHPNLWQDDSSGPVVYLTFDDGPNPNWTPQILDVLDQYDAQATFFVMGSRAAEHPGIVNDIARRGHGIGNHTYTHSSMAGMSFGTFQWQVQATEDAVGPEMSSCLRPPYGATDANTRAFASQLGYELVMWDVDPRDWESPGVQAITDRVLGNVSPGDTVLFHDGGGNRSQTVQALDRILSNLDDQGYRFEARCQ